MSSDESKPDLCYCHLVGATLQNDIKTITLGAVETNFKRAEIMFQNDFLSSAWLMRAYMSVEKSSDESSVLGNSFSRCLSTQMETVGVVYHVPLSIKVIPLLIIGLLSIRCCLYFWGKIQLHIELIIVMGSFWCVYGMCNAKSCRRIRERKFRIIKESLLQNKIGTGKESWTTPSSIVMTVESITRPLTLREILFSCSACSHAPCVCNNARDRDRGLKGITSWCRHFRTQVLYSARSKPYSLGLWHFCIILTTVAPARRNLMLCNCQSHSRISMNEA